MTSGNWTAAGFLILEILATLSLAYFTHTKAKRLFQRENDVVEELDIDKVDSAELGPKESKDVGKAAVVRQTDEISS